VAASVAACVWRVLRPPLPQPAALAGPLLHFKVPLPLLLMAGTEQKAVKNARIYPQICSHGGPPGFFFPGLLQSQYRSHNFLELRANTSFPRNSVRRTVTQLSMWGTIKYVMVTVK